MDTMDSFGGVGLTRQEKLWAWEIGAGLGSGADKPRGGRAASDLMQELRNKSQGKAGRRESIEVPT